MSIESIIQFSKGKFLGGVETWRYMLKKAPLPFNSSTSSGLRIIELTRLIIQDPVFIPMLSDQMQEIIRISEILFF
jgi:hypothetical protein